MNSKEAKNTLGEIEALYTRNLQEHGFISKSVGWKDEKSQLIRFEKLMRVISYEQKRHKLIINDFGCGYGAMFKYLVSHPRIKLKKYYGYDISKEMLIAANKIANDERSEWIHSETIHTEADYTFVSGTFNVRFETQDDVWVKFILNNLQAISKKSRKGFAFNLLSTYVDWKDDHLYYGDPLFFFDFCKKKFSRYVSILHDYPLYEWTICVRKEE